MTTNKARGSTHLQIDQQICHSLYSAANALVRTYRPLLEPLDLTYPQYLVMLCLWQQDQVSVKALSEQTRLDSGTLTPILKRLEGKTLIERKRSRTDERQRVIHLSKKGRELRTQAESIPGTMTCLVDMSAEQARELKHLAELLYAGLPENTHRT